MDASNKRNIALDNLKIIAMLMIVFEHMLLKSGVMDLLEKGSLVYYCVWTLRYLVKVNVNLFVLISSYFLVESKFNFKHLIMNIMQVQFFTIVTTCLSVMLGIMDLTMKDVIRALFPIISGAYWFSTCYIGLYLIFPILNCVIRKLSNKQLLMTLIIGYGVQCLYPFFFYWSREETGRGKNLTWFIILYFTGAYIKKYVHIGNQPKKTGLFVYLSLSICGLFSKILVELLSAIVGSSKIGGLSSILLSNDSPSIYIGAIALFIFFAGLNIKQNNKLVETIIFSLSKHSYAVYLIHDGILASVIWRTINIKSYIHHRYFGVLLFLIPLAIYMICVFIDIPRSFLFVKLGNSRFIKNICNQVKIFEIFENDNIKEG